jgi:hypothetical protein
MFYKDTVRYPEAERLLQCALDVWERVRGPHHPDVATVLCNLAALRIEQGKYSESEALLQRALVIRQDVLGPEHPDVASVPATIWF